MKVKFLSLVLLSIIFVVCGSSYAQGIKPVEMPSDKVMKFGREKAKDENKQSVANETKLETEEKSKPNWRTRVDPKLYDMPRNYKVPLIIK